MGRPDLNKFSLRTISLTKRLLFSKDLATSIPNSLPLPTAPPPPTPLPALTLLLPPQPPPRPLPPLLMPPMLMPPMLMPPMLKQLTQQVPLPRLLPSQQLEVPQELSSESSLLEDLSEEASSGNPSKELVKVPKVETTISTADSSMMSSTEKPNHIHLVC